MDQIERLSSADMVNPIKLEREIARANALTQVGNTLINSAKAEVAFLKQIDSKDSSFYSMALPESSAPAPAPLPEIPFTDVEEVPGKPLPQIKQKAARADALLLEEKVVPVSDDLSKKKPVRINAKTTIYIDKDADEEEARQRYIQKHNITQF